MSQRSFFGVLLDTCDQCAGIFFDEGEINQIRERGGIRAFDELDNMIQPTPEHIATHNESSRKCPSCYSVMSRFRYMYSSPVFLDSCDNCNGVWIENGELQQMREYIQSAKDGQRNAGADRENSASKLTALNALERARALRARIAASMVAYHKD